MIPNCFFGRTLSLPRRGALFESLFYVILLSQLLWLSRNYVFAQQQTETVSSSTTATQQQVNNKRFNTLPKTLLPSSLTSEQELGLERDPNLQLMKYDVGDGEKSTYVFIEPSIEQMYQQTKQSSSTTTPTQKVTPKFNGLATKFINMSHKPLTLYWEEYAGGPSHAMAYHEPFTASGTGSFPGHRFFFADAGPGSTDNDSDDDNDDDDDDERIQLKLFIVGEYPQNIYYYDPYHIDNDPKQTEENLSILDPEEREQYDNWRRTILFNEYYLNTTGRSYLANYLRSPPAHHMWRADYFGQEHWVMTKEKQFVQLPQYESDLQEIKTIGTDRILSDDQPRILEQYRDPTIKLMNMTLKVLSVAPRVFEIPNFLSQVEVDHVLQLAAGIELGVSQTGDAERKVQDTTNTRTSYNSWVKREKSPIIDAIYRRAADLLRIDESLLRSRGNGEYNDLSTDTTIAEELQLVHYQDEQKYEAHHDFGYARIDSGVDGYQCARFSTLLLYLNDKMIGGETSFPRWVNGETFRQLKVKPESGKAVLFYSQLPDGNLDDFSQHAALPVTDGEKWLINLWVWDPLMD